MLMALSIFGRKSPLAGNMHRPLMFSLPGASLLLAFFHHVLLCSIGLRQPRSRNPATLQLQGSATEHAGSRPLLSCT
jgi:hypothetical protein